MVLIGLRSVRMSWVQSVSQKVMMAQHGQLQRIRLRVVQLKELPGMVLIGLRLVMIRLTHIQSLQVLME